MKVIITESQYNRLVESKKVVDNILNKITQDGYDSLSIDEKKYLKYYSEHINNGGDPEEFVDPSEKYDDREGKVIKGEISGQPIQFTYSEEIENDGETEYYGEVKFNDDEFLGVIMKDKRGYITGYDFYSVMSDDDVRLQSVIGNLNYELINWFSEEVIPQLENN